MSPKAWRRCGGTVVGSGPRRPMVRTMSGSNIWILGGMRRAYSWKSSMTMRGHSVMTLKDSTLRVCIPVGTASAPTPTAPVAASPNIVVTVSFTPLYTSHTNCRKGATSDSSDGRKLRCRSKMIRRQMSALSSFSARSASIVSRSSSLSCGRKISLCGKRLSISSTTLRSLCSGESSAWGGTDSSTFWKAGRYAARNLGYSDVLTISMASRTSVASCSRSLAPFVSCSCLACAAN
mmetsp:Transcript_18729/g.46519  ORF Transcript_18729/g.46519 Transcript_18729/m.46519 type:complete len:235 (+) Transcript_18729:90-794(+)